MMYVVVCLAALVAAGLTLVSGFGLGTLLMPAFAVFFPVKVAIAATAVVHLANNLFKVGLVGKHAQWRTVFLFAVPAAPAAVAGAWVLELLSSRVALATYRIGTREFEVTPVRVIVGVLMIGFACLELWPRFDRLEFPRRLIPLGGVVSGFFGGLSGHQGALRAAFLARAGLSKEAFIGTGTVAAVIVDVARLAIYSGKFGDDWRVMREGGGQWLVLAATLAAFVGSLLGARLVRKVTMRGVRGVVGVMLLLLGGALGAGLV